MTPFLRLALYACSAIVAGVIAYVWMIELWVGVASLVGGAILALIAGLERAPDEEPVEEEPAPEQTQAAEAVLQRRGRRDIERAAIRGREDLEQTDGLGP